MLLLFAFILKTSNYFISCSFCRDSRQRAGKETLSDALKCDVALLSEDRVCVCGGGGGEYCLESPINKFMSEKENT